MDVIDRITGSDPVSTSESSMLGKKKKGSCYFIKFEKKKKTEAKERQTTLSDSTYIS